MRSLLGGYFLPPILNVEILSSVAASELCFLVILPTVIPSHLDLGWPIECSLSDIA